ncbi:hypothetical protein ACFYZB_34545 [Streptomyces sp. NPDC001852]|uniref:hypothetical protein n=1 Tax=Streptomyces sp. NPDC001852 TaxID=3364619 RepID=UPI00369AC8DE
MGTWSVEVAVSSLVVSDESVQAARGALKDIRGDLAGLPVVAGGVDRVADASVPGRQGGDLLRFALEMAPGALDAVLMVIRARREARSSGASVPLETSVRVTGPDGVARETVLRGDADDVVRALRELQDVQGDDDAAAGEE